jgi:NAD(P)-dependent dehydrogenase (short-subunit alcohol dehydrogenase family)
MRFAGKVAIITGASRGIGKATALQLGKEGATVVVNYKSNEKEAEAVVSELGGKHAIAIQADVSKESEVVSLISNVAEKYGHIDVLINNAGEISSRGWKTSTDQWHQTIDANLTSAWLMTREVVPHMQKNGGSIVNLVSVYGFLGAAPVLAYTSAKGGLITMTKSFAKELAPNIRVNAIAPSNVETDMTKSAGPDLIAYFIDQTPLKRIAKPEELAKAIAFLASDDASYITGEMLVVDGGYSLK